MQGKIKKIWNSVTTVLVALMVLLAALLWGFRLLGYEVLVVQSGSMEPDYPVGSLVYVKATDPAQLEEGDVITFNLGGGVRCTHRIIEVLGAGEDLSFRTKGDANDVDDGNPVLPRDLVGQVKFCVPLLGFLIAKIQSPPGLYLAVSVVAVLLLLTILPDMIFPDEKKKQEESE